MADNIVLIGMPGAGKSTVGVVLAKRLGWGFVDCDLVIQERTGRRLAELIELHGHQGFLAIEDQTIASLNPLHHVIATGGSAIHGATAMARLRSIGTIVYLKLPLAAIEQRVGELADRGVAMAPGQTLADLYHQRAPHYDRWADLTVDCAGLELREVVARVDHELANRAVD